LSLHDALPIDQATGGGGDFGARQSLTNLAALRQRSGHASALRRRGGFALRPRFFGARAVCCPLAACLRQVSMWEEYNLSRRRKAPRSPLGVASYCRSTWSLYSVVNRRRWGLANTSGSAFAARFCLAFTFVSIRNNRTPVGAKRCLSDA